MRYTTNYELPLFDADDRIQRQDFNEGTQKVENALAALQTSALQMATDAYVGTGTSGFRSITVGFQPRLLLIFPQTFDLGKGYFVTPARPLQFSGYSACEITQTGFRVQNVNSNNDPRLNEQDMTFAYVAFA